MTRALLLALALAAAGCGQPTTSARGFPLGDLTVRRNGHLQLALTVEIADTSAAWQKGLMGVPSLPRDQGMAFVFPGEVTLGFWMKDTLIPLDIAFADAQGRVVDVQHMTPCIADPCPLYYATRPYAMAVEAASGVLTSASVQSGDVMTLKRRGHATPPPSGVAPCSTPGAAWCLP